MAGESQACHLLVIPFPAQGHMPTLLNLANLLSLRGLAITIVVTPKNLHLLSSLLSASPSVQPLVLSFPDYPDLPPGIENTKGLHQFLSLRLAHALSLLHPDIISWAKSAANPPDAIISDFFHGWTNKLAQELSIPRIVFSPSGAFTISLIHHMWRDVPKSAKLRDVISLPFDIPTVPNSPTFPLYQLPGARLAYVEGDPFSEFLREGFLGNVESWGYVINTFHDLEGVYLDHLRRDLGHRRVWAVGPLNLSGGGDGDGSVLGADLLSWLDRRDTGSVIYVCFGSHTTLTGAQVEALAAGLENSGAQFIWCVKEVPTATVPEGFDERVKDRGLVIRGWAPQVQILNHPSVGWFLTHCGWNSVTEGIAAGVAMLTWPMGADQFVGARLLEEEMRIGVRVCEGRDAVPNPNELGRIIAQVINQNAMERAGALQLKEKSRMAVAEGGSSYRDVEGLAEALNEIKSRGYSLS